MSLPRQPDDPGAPPTADQYGLVAFKDDILGRRTAWIGEVMIGQIIPTGGGIQKATVLIDLPHIGRKSLPATSILMAQKILAREADQWLDRAKLGAVRT